MPALSADQIGRLKDLAALHDALVLTDQEFAEQKAELLTESRGTPAPAPAVYEDPQRVVTKGGAPTKVLYVQPQQTVLLPAKSLKRVFLGVGWKVNQGAGEVDVDCSCVAFDANGTRSENDTIWWRNLSNGTGKQCTIRHTGDVLTGQDKPGDLIDQERIYAHLEKLAPAIQTLAFEADIYSQGKTFSSLSAAYVRIVNADTDQEIARLNLDPKSGIFGDNTALLFCRLKRVQNGAAWSFETGCEARPQRLREMSDPHPDMLPPAELAVKTSGGSTGNNQKEVRFPLPVRPALSRSANHR